MRGILLSMVSGVLAIAGGSAFAGELVINADTGINVDAIVTKAEIQGTEVFAPKANDARLVREDIPERIIRITDREPSYDNAAAALNAIVPAAGEEMVREPSDGGALGAMPLTAAEEFARKRGR